MKQLNLKRWVSCIGVSLFCLPVGAQEADWPTRSVRLVVPYPAGGGVDFAARIFAKDLAEQTGQTFVVENRSGAAGIIGTQAVIQSAADGYTILFSSPAEVVVSKIAGQAMPYEVSQSLEPVTLAGETPLAIVAHPEQGFTNLNELKQYAHTHPQALVYGSPGTGSTMHFAGEAFNLGAQSAIAHVPYRGAAPAITDVLGNQIPLVITGVPPVVGHHKSGKLKILALTGNERLASLPDIPTVSETPGFENYRFTNWFGVFVPKGTPESVSQKINRLFKTAVTQESVLVALSEQGIEPIASSKTEFIEFLEQENKRYSAVQEKSQISID